MHHHKLLLALTSALTLAFATSQAQTPTPSPMPAPTASAAAAPAPAPGSSWVVTPAFASQYMFRGTRFGGPSFQPSVEFDSGPLVAGVWANTPIADKVKGQSDPEFDLYGSYTIETIKDTLSWAPGFTAYLFPRAKGGDGFYKITLEPNLAVNYTVAGVKLTPKIYYDFILKGPTYEFNAAYAVPLKSLGTELDFTANVGTFKWRDALEDTTPKAKNWGNYWLAGVAAPFQINPTSKLTLGWAYTRGTGNYVKIGSTPKAYNPTAVGRGVVTIAYALSF